MAKKETKLEYVKSVDGAVGAVAHFRNPSTGKTYQVTLYTDPNMKVLKAKAQLKSEFPDYVAAWLNDHPGYEVCGANK